LAVPQEAAHTLLLCSLNTSNKFSEFDCLRFAALVVSEKANRCYRYVREGRTLRNERDRLKLAASILNRKSICINSLLSGNSLKSRQNSAILVLIALHCQSAFLIAIRPSQTDEVLLGLCKRHKRTQTERKNTDANSGSNAPVNILSITYVRHARGRY
jgi:hypothetical protein